MKSMEKGGLLGRPGTYCSGDCDRREKSIFDKMVKKYLEFQVVCV